MARITSVSGRQCPTGCDDEDLARAPSIFGLVTGMSRHRPTADVLHLTDEERRDNIDLETWPRHRNASSAGSREDELIEFKRFQQQLSKRSVNHQRFPRRFQPPQRRASPAVGGDKNDFNHHEEMQDREAPVLTRRTLLKLNMLCHRLVEVRRPSGSWVAPIDIVRAAVAGMPEFGMTSGTWTVKQVLRMGGDLRHTRT